MGQQLQPCRILIIDDNQDAADALAEIFSLHGYLTSVALGGPPGLAAISSFCPDVVFLDIGMDGYQVAAQLRKMDNIRQPLLIAFTAWNDDDAKAKVTAAGFDLHMTKTEKFSVLLDAVSQSPPARHVDH